jgi:hypothetical protein
LGFDDPRPSPPVEGVVPGLAGAVGGGVAAVDVPSPPEVLPSDPDPDPGPELSAVEVADPSEPPSLVAAVPERLSVL